MLEKTPMFVARTLGKAASLIFALSACSTEEPTEIVAGVSTQMRVPEGLKGVGLLVQADGAVLFCEHYAVIDGIATLPATLGVLEKAQGRAVTVQVLGFRTEDPAFLNDCYGGNRNTDDDQPGEVVVVRRRRLTFVSDRILFLPLPLKESCSDTTCSEDAGQTCIGGACVPMDIDATTLPEYQDNLIFGDTSTCFDPALCMPGAGSLPVLLEDPDNCTFRAQWPGDEPLPSDGLNVRMLYSSLGSEILDLDSLDLTEDQHDGMSLPDPNDSLRFRLAPNLCDTNYKAGKILGLEASPLCPGKRPFQPMCDSAFGVGSGEPDAGSGTAGAAGKPGICTIAALASVESAAYVLMDSSFGMYKFYGDGGLRFAVELPLSNPVARGTRMAFDLLPADAAQCDVPAADNTFATPQIAFGDVSDVRGPIGDLLGNQGTVLMDDPPVLMEAAMEGAYKALAELVPGTAASGFNRKALVVIGNRGFFETCATNGITPAQRALAAFNSADPIYTYAVVLENEADPASSAAEVAEATAVAQSGGTEVFNGVADEAEGAAAVQKVLNDLGSCLYEVNPLTGAQSALPDDALISYVNPLLPLRATTDIARNAACTAAADEAGEADISGWNREGSNLVRICGEACADLRDVLDAVAGLHALGGHVAPSVPLVVSATCLPDDAFSTPD